MTVHDLTFLHYPDLVDAASLAYRELVPRAVRRAAAVLTPTRAIADEVVDAYRVPADRVRVTPLGVDASWAGATAERPAPAPERYLLAVGTLEPRKGIDVLLDAYRAMKAELPATPPLVLVGPAGWGAMPNTSDLRDQVILTGYVDAAALRGLVAHAELLAYPSQYEGFGLPPLEALAAGTPVVASDVPALREVLLPYAQLVVPGDAMALADALRRTLERPPSAEQIVAAREHASGYTWQRCARLTADVYREVAG